jgi:hypothetical protein
MYFISILMQRLDLITFISDDSFIKENLINRITCA